MTTITQEIAALPTPPSPASPSTFEADSDAFLGGLPTFRTQLNTYAGQVNTVGEEITQAVLDVEAYATSAQVTATAWVSGTTYSIGVTRYSPITYQTYRRKTAGAGTTDPSMDSTNWALVGRVGELEGTATGTINLLTGTSIASASTLNLDSATGNRVHVTGTNAINAVTLTHGPRTVIFDGALTLTHHATNNNLPGGANITTAAGDRAVYESDGTTVYCTQYTRANLAAGIYTSLTSKSLFLSDTSQTVMLHTVTGGGTNAKKWVEYSGGTTLTVAAQNDADTDSRAAWSATRSSYTIASITYGNSTDLPLHTFYGDISIAGKTGGSTAPTRISMDGSFSTTAGAGPKLSLYDDGTNLFGLGVSSGQLDYMAASTHAFYSDGDLKSSLASTGIWSATNFSATSDERLKENWSDIEPGLVYSLAGLKSGTYDLIGNQEAGRQCGISGQQLREFLPEAVIEAKDTGLLSVNYGHAAMISCVELAKEIVEIKRQLAALQESE